MEIRKANLDDSKKLDSLLTELIHDEKQYDDNINQNFVVNNYHEHKLILDDNVAFVAVDGDKIVGYIYGFISCYPNVVLEKIAKLDALYIEQDYRNKGIGKQLVSEFKKWSLEVGAKYVELSVLKDNEYGKKLYRDCGFELQKEYLICKLEGE